MTLIAVTSNKGIAHRNAEKVIRWTEDGDTFFAEDGKARLEVFPAPFKAGRYCWRRFRMNVYWRVQDGGIADTIEKAMDAAAMSLVAR